MLIDLHTHTNTQSWDSFLRPEDLVRRARRAGLDGICITEHDFFWPAESIARLAEAEGFLVLPGVELTTEEGHLLVFGLDRYVFGMHRASFVKKLVEEAHGAVIGAHPYRRRFLEDGASTDPFHYNASVARACADPLFQMVDAVEWWNGRGSSRQNAFSQDVVRRLGLRAVAGSDAHSPEDIGACATYFERRIENLRDLIACLKEGCFRPVRLRPAGGL
ncbi:MAG: PHP domain-containing protein [Chloroflexi bacterium]|nr:PHP domain-containing protein [Chloroflexota bacterium]